MKNVAVASHAHYVREITVTKKVPTQAQRHLSTRCFAQS